MNHLIVPELLYVPMSMKPLPFGPRFKAYKIYVTPFAERSSCMSSGPVLLAIESYFLDSPMIPEMPLYT